MTPEQNKPYKGVESTQLLFIKGAPPPLLLGGYSNYSWMGGSMRPGLAWSLKPQHNKKTSNLLPRQRQISRLLEPCLRHFNPFSPKKPD